MNAGRAFQPEICPEGASRRGVLNHEWTRITTNSCSAGVVAGQTQGCVFEPRMDTNNREFVQRGQWLRVKRRGGVLNHEWTLMDTNSCSAGFSQRFVLHSSVSVVVS
jgi:hypothetical protein